MYRLKGCGNNADGFTVKTERQNLAFDDGASKMLEFRQVRTQQLPPNFTTDFLLSPSTRFVAQPSLTLRPASWCNPTPNHQTAFPY